MESNPASHSDNPSVNPSQPMARRRFLQLSAGTVGAAGALELGRGAEQLLGGKSARGQTVMPIRRGGRGFNAAYSGENLNHIAFPLGGMGAGMVCLEGTGAFSHVSLRQQPEVFNEPMVFAAVSVRGLDGAARVLEGPVPARKVFGRPGTGNGAGGSTFGLPRFAQARFEARFPFATVDLEDRVMPLRARITGWSPFEPGDADNSSLPVAALEYELINTSSGPVSGVFSFNAKNFMVAGTNPQAIRPIAGGFILWGGPHKERPWEEAAFAATVSEPNAKVNHAWFRGGWFDSLTLAWKDIATGAAYDRPPITEGAPSPGASLFVPFDLARGGTRKIVVRLAWFVGQTNLRIGKDLKDSSSSPAQPQQHKPW